MAKKNSKNTYDRINSKYVLTYNVDNVINKMVIDANIKQRSGMVARNQCVYECIICVDGIRVDRPDIENYVNAKFAIEDIYDEYRNELKSKYRVLGKKFKTIKEEFK